MVAVVSEKAPHSPPDNADLLRRRANRRLLGASVLLLVAIITVPMFLEREPPPLPDNVDVRIPPVEGTKFEPKFPVSAVSDGKKSAVEKPADIPAITEPTGAQAGVSALPAAPAVTPTAPTKPAATDAAKAISKLPEKAPEKAPEKTPEKAASKSPTAAPPAPTAAEVAARKPGQLVVQVVAVRDPAAAKQLYDKARSLKFPAYTEKIDVTNGVVTRVRVGPYANKAQAESARAKLAQAGFEAKIVTLQ